MKFLQGIGTFFSTIFNGIINFFKLIIESITTFFKRKYPKDGLDIAAVLQAAIVTLITMAVIFVFDTFQLKDINQLLIAGGIAFVISLIFSFLTSLVSKGNWTLVQHLLKQFVLFAAIALGCLIYFQKGINFEQIGLFSLLGLIPSILHLFFNQNITESKYTNLASELNEKLKNTKVNNAPVKTLVLENKNGNNLSLLPNQIISIQEKGSSLEVKWQNLFDTEITTIQNTLSGIEKSLKESPQFAKCNASTLVNIYAIKNAIGDAHGLNLEIAKSTETINVSRNKVGIVQNSSLGN